jgi:O-antigen/teichoic acid export membrane protein
MKVVAFYTTPYEMVTKLLVGPGALTGVLFPAFSTSLASNPDKIIHLYRRGLKYAFILLIVPVTLIVIFAKGGLALWLGRDFAGQSFQVLQWLAIGVLMNGMASIPFSLIQGVGRADITGKLHLIQLPIYLGFLWWMVMSFGIQGAAIAWCARVTLDFVALMWISHRSLPVRASVPFQFVGLLVLVFVVLGALTLVHNPLLEVALCLFMILVSVRLSWRFMLVDEERNLIRQLKMSMGFSQAE